jgi:tRNA(fMet)-specific endonuclease VapC
VTLRFLLDSDVVSAPISRKPAPGVMAQLELHGHESAIAAPVWHELTFGCQRLPQGKRRDAIEAYLEDVVKATFPILAYDEAAAAWHGRERARLERLGSPAPFVDGQIASIAHVTSLALVTFNAQDYARFKDVILVNWKAQR